MEAKIREILERLYSDGSFDEEFPSKEAETRVNHALTQILEEMEKGTLREEEILDFLDIWGYRQGNMMKYNDDDFRKIAHILYTAQKERRER